MNILFLSLIGMTDSSSGGLYADLVREFSSRGHNVYAVTPVREDTSCTRDGNGATVIKVKNGQIQKANKVKKLINLLTLERKTVKAVKKYAKGVKFDLIVNMCSNQCFAKTSAYFKKRDKAINYLLLKDIFPQNAIDIGMLKTGGIMGIACRHFKNKEKKLYRNADYIGCLSMANCEFLIKHNPWLDKNKLLAVPNGISPRDVSLNESQRAAMREKYGLPQDKKIFIYGGNLGKPQDIPFVIECLKACGDIGGAYFFIVGDGTEYGKLEQFLKEDNPRNVKLMKRLAREDFDAMLAACDAGLIFLDYRFTVPNYPSRLLSYMQAGLPVIACTDPNTDVGKDIEEGGFGWRCQSNDAAAFAGTVRAALASLEGKGERSLAYLKEHFTAERSYNIITGSLNESADG